MADPCSCGCARRARTWPIIALAVAIALIPNLAYAVAGNFSSAATGTAGVKGTNTSNGTGAKGAIGYVSSTGTATNYGVYGLTKSRAGRGVLGYASAATGTTYGVYGRTDSAGGFGVYSFGNLGVLLGKNIICTGCVQPQGLATSSGTPFANVLTTLDTVGLDTSITMGADGLGFIIYATSDAGPGDLKVAHCSNTACTAATQTVFPTPDHDGNDNSVTIGSDGLPLIAHQDKTDSDLLVTHCSNVTCTAATTTTVASAGDVGQDTSVTIGTDGFPLISYNEEVTQDLKVVHCTNVACTTKDSPVTLDGDVALELGQDSSVIIGTDGFGLITYHDFTNLDLKVVHCTNTACSTFDTPVPIDSTGAVGEDTSLTLGVDGLGLVTYLGNLDVVGDTDLKVAHCADVACTSATATTIDSTGDAGDSSSLAIGPDGLGLISYHNGTDLDLKVAHCSNVACTAATTTIAHGSGDYGDDSSLTIGPDGLGLISYVNAGEDELRVLHCASVFCLPYWRR